MKPVWQVCKLVEASEALFTCRFVWLWAVCFHQTGAQGLWGLSRSLGLTLCVQTNLHMCHRPGTSQTGLRYYLYVTGKPVHGKQSGEMMWHVNLATVLLSSRVDRTDFFLLGTKPSARFTALFLKETWSSQLYWLEVSWVPNYLSVSRPVCTSILKLCLGMRLDPWLCVSNSCHLVVEEL